MSSCSPRSTQVCVWQYPLPCYLTIIGFVWTEHHSQTKRPFLSVQHGVPPRAHEHPDHRRCPPETHPATSRALRAYPSFHHLPSLTPAIRTATHGHPRATSTHLGHMISTSPTLSQLVSQSSLLPQKSTSPPSHKRPSAMPPPRPLPHSFPSKAQALQHRATSSKFPVSSSAQPQKMSPPSSSAVAISRAQNSSRAAMMFEFG
jgi:hypothetical protein